MPFSASMHCEFNPKSCNFDWSIFSCDFPNMVLYENKCTNALYNTNHKELYISTLVNFLYDIFTFFFFFFFFFFLNLILNITYITLHYIIHYIKKTFTDITLHCIILHKTYYFTYATRYRQITVRVKNLIHSPKDLIIL